MIAETTVDPILQFAQYGIAGLVIIGLLIGWIWPRPSVERLLTDNEQLRVQRDDLVAYHQTQTIPTLIRANEVMARFAAEQKKRDER